MFILFIQYFAMDQSFSPTAQKQFIHEMYLDHHDLLQQWLSYRIRYPFNAADLVQDTFVKLLQTRQKLLGIQEPRAYLVNVAKNVLIDKHRRYVLEQSYLETLAGELQLQEIELSNNQLEEVVQILDFLTIALNESPVLARKAFLMYYFEGYNQTEIAKRIGKSLRTTQTYLADCLNLCLEAREQLLESEHD